MDYLDGKRNYGFHAMNYTQLNCRDTIVIHSVLLECLFLSLFFHLLLFLFLLLLMLICLVFMLVSLVLMLVSLVLMLVTLVFMVMLAMVMVVMVAVWWDWGMDVCRYRRGRILCRLSSRCRRTRARSRDRRR